MEFWLSWNHSSFSTYSKESYPTRGAHRCHCENERSKKLQNKSTESCDSSWTCKRESKNFIFFSLFFFFWFLFSFFFSTNFIFDFFFVFNFQSPFWELKEFSDLFYFRFLICELHLMDLGILTRWILYLGIKYGKQYCQGSN